MRKHVKPYDQNTDWGAAEYGHKLVFYTPSYGGETVRISVECLEIDRLGGNDITKLGKAMRGLGELPVFAPQLSYLALASEALELGRKLYNIFNTNDTVLLEHLDLGNSPYENKLSSGRFVLVRGSHDPKQFIEQYKLGSDNKLCNKDNIPAEKTGLTDPYVVLSINAVERNEYKNFELDSAGQEILDAVLNQKNITENLATLITDTVKGAKHYSSVGKVMELKRKTDKEKDDEKKKMLKANIENELKRLDEEQVSLVKEALGLD
jgi:hypothetical protein